MIKTTNMNENIFHITSCIKTLYDNLIANAFLYITF